MSNGTQNNIKQEKCMYQLTKISLIKILKDELVFLEDNEQTTMFLSRKRIYQKSWTSIFLQKI